MQGAGGVGEAEALPDDADTLAARLRETGEEIDRWELWVRKGINSLGGAQLPRLALAWAPPLKPSATTMCMHPNNRSSHFPCPVLPATE